MQTAVRMEPSDIQWSEMKMDERSPAGETTVRNDTKIADVAVKKRHQWRDKIRIFFTRTSSHPKVFFKNCHAIYTFNT